MRQVNICNFPLAHSLAVRYWELSEQLMSVALRLYCHEPQLWCHPSAHSGSGSAVTLWWQPYTRGLSWDFILVLVTFALSLLWFHLTSRTSLVWPGWNQVWFVFFFLSINFYDSDIHAFCPREKGKIKIWWNDGEPMCALNKEILYLYLKKKIPSVIGILLPKSN